MINFVGEGGWPAVECYGLGAAIAKRIKQAAPGPFQRFVGESANRLIDLGNVIHARSPMVARSAK
jgi:hypothetical protein